MVRRRIRDGDSFSVDWYTDLPNPNITQFRTVALVGASISCWWKEGPYETMLVFRSIGTLIYPVRNITQFRTVALIGWLGLTAF